MAGLFARWRIPMFAVLAMLLLLPGRALAIPVFANGQGVSCQTCHTTYPGMTRYGMMIMMSNFQLLKYHLQRQAFPTSMRVKITSFLANKSQAAQTQVADTSLLSGGFLGPNFTWYNEQHLIDTGQPGITEQAWLSWNGLLHGINSLQVGKFHTPFPFMPAHAWTLGSYLLATQPTGQNTFVPNDAHWGIAFNGMSNEFMYNVSYLAGAQPTQQALDFNPADSPRTLDFNVGYGGMSIPWSLGLVAMRGFAPLHDPLTNAFVGSDAFSRAGLYFGYQTDFWHLQTMYYHGFDAHPNLGERNVSMNGAMFELERDFGWRNHILVRYDVGSSDTLNRQYLVDVSHDIAPNIKLIGELGMGPGLRPQIGFGFGLAGPWQHGKRYITQAPPGQSGPLQVALVSASAPSSGMAGMSGVNMSGMKMSGMTMPGMKMTNAAAPTSMAASADPNLGARLVAANGCSGCHGAHFEGGLGPKLVGIEKRLSPVQIADFIAHPHAPMPSFGFSAGQIGDIVAYLSGLDGAGGTQPTVRFIPAAPGTHSRIEVRFPETPPTKVLVLPRMEMGGMKMGDDSFALHPDAHDPHLFVGTITFTMTGPWIVRIVYGTKHLDVPVTVGGS